MADRYRHSLRIRYGEKPLFWRRLEGGGIAFAQVGLGLDDAGLTGPAHEHLVEEVGRDDPGVTPVEVTRERLQCDSASRTDAGTGVGVFFLGTTLT